MVLPGMGQAYNRKYYKIPIVWGALGVGVYSIVYNTKKYEEATRDYLQDETDTHEAYMKGYRRNMELSYIVTTLLYGLQMLDAYVDANLYTWESFDESRSIAAAHDVAYQSKRLIRGAYMQF